MSEPPPRPERVTAPASAPAVHTPSRSENVVVGCKLPNGVHLQLQRKTRPTDPVTGREYDFWERMPGGYTLNGIALDHAKLARAEMPEFLLVGSPRPSAFTTIPRAFWEEWVEQNKHTPLYLSGDVWGSDNETDARVMAKERSQQRTGFEPVDPDNPNERPIGRKIETAERPA